jgi:Uma2 family endonuclease
LTVSAERSFLGATLGPEVKAMTARAVWTYADYAAMPDDGRRCELWDGELSVTPASELNHQGILRDLLGMINEHVKRLGLGVVFPSPVDCILADTTVLQPDLAFIADDRRSILTPRAIEGPPTLVVEICSPSTRRADRTVKAGLYARYGVPWSWIVDAGGGTIEAFALRDGSYEPAGRLQRGEPGALPPLDGLVIDVGTLLGV